MAESGSNAAHQSGRKNKLSKNSPLMRLMFKNSYHNGALKNDYFGPLKNENNKLIFLRSEIVTLN